MIIESLCQKWWERDWHRNAMPWEDLENFPKLGPIDRRNRLQRLLHSQMAYFGKRGDALPEWREAARIDEPAELWKDWPTLPILSRASLQTHFHPGDIALRFGIDGRIDSTGGSTGEPTPFFHDKEMIRACGGLGNHARLAMGWRPGRPTIVIWGSERDIGKQVGFRHRLRNALFRNLLVDGYQMSRKTAEKVLILVRRHGPLAIYGYSSMMEFVAREAIAMGAHIPPHSVYLAWNGGEALFPKQSELFESAFGVPILNLYGGREFSAIAFQPNAGSSLRIQRPWLFVELVDENGRPAAPGEPGRIVVTSTICRGTPFLRYEIGDLGEYADADRDESGIGALRVIHGRIASVVTLPNGKRIQSNYWNHLMKEFTEVQQFQVEIKTNGELLLRLRGSGFSSDREAALRGILRAFIGDIPLSIHWVDRIPLTRQGKLIQVIRESTNQDSA